MTDQTGGQQTRDPEPPTDPRQDYSRREFVHGALAIGGAVTTGSLIAACGGSSSPSSASTTASGGTPTRGGLLRAGVTSGGNTETLDPHKALSNADIARTMNLYERLSDYAPDGSVIMLLAESFTPNRTVDEWTVKLKPGVTFHSGKPLTADDVIYSYSRILNPKNALQGAADLEMIDPKRMTRVDATTVRFGLLYPYADLPDACAQRSLAIIPDGFTTFSSPDGTGPFKYQSFTVGQQSMFTRNDHYWESGKPYVDRLQILSIADPGARLDGLQAGQLDAIESPDLARAKALQTDSTIKILNSRTGGFVPITISVVAKPFDDPRVRQALRLLADRSQLVESALVGFGWIGNDLFCPFDQFYDHSLPQRQQDIEQAKSLLAQAGQQSLTFNLYTSQAAPGMQESALLYSTQAKQAGVTVNVKTVPADSFYNTVYLKVPVTQSQWENRSLAAQIAQCANSNSPYNETHWRRPEFDKLTAEARSTLDEQRRRQLYAEAQTMLYDQGGYLIWGFSNLVDAYRSNVHGFVPSVVRDLDQYGFKQVWLT